MLTRRFHMLTWYRHIGIGSVILLVIASMTLGAVERAIHFDMLNKLATWNAQCSADRIDDAGLHVNCPDKGAAWLWQPWEIRQWLAAPQKPFECHGFASGRIDCHDLKEANEQTNQ